MITRLTVDGLMQSSIFMYGWIDVDMITSISLCLSLISLQLVILIKVMKTFNSPFKKKHFKFRPYWLKYEQTIVTKLQSFTMDFFYHLSITFMILSGQQFMLVPYRPKMAEPLRKGDRDFSTGKQT